MEWFIALASEKKKDFVSNIFFLAEISLQILFTALVDTENLLPKVCFWETNLKQVHGKILTYSININILQNKYSFDAFITFCL